MAEKQQAEQSGGKRVAFPDAENIVETVREPLLVLDVSLQVLRAIRPLAAPGGRGKAET